MKRGIGYEDLITNAIERPFQEEYPDLPPESWKELMPENAVVRTEIVERDGSFIVYLIYIDLEDPRKLVRMPARVCRSRKSAEILASYKCRFCECDQCVPFQVDMDDFNCCMN
jgi:hypothetical protein